MEPNDFIRFLSSALLVPTGIPLVFILVDGWRQPAYIMRRLAALYFIWHTAFCTGAYWLFGPRTAGILAGIIPVLVCWGLYAMLTRYRDGRFLFTVVTIVLLLSELETITCLILPYGTPYYLLCRLTFTGFTALLMWMFGRRAFKSLLHSVDKGWVRMSLIPLAFLLSIVTVYELPIIIGKGCPNPIVAVLMCAVTPLVYAALYFFAQTMRAQYQAQQDALVLRAQVQALTQQFEQVRVNDRKSRIFRHDLRHYVQLLKVALETGGCAEVQKLLILMEQEVDELAPGNVLCVYTGNGLVDSVLSVYAAQAREANVRFEVRLLLPDSLRDAMAELAVVLSNALENAMHACADMPEGQARVIRVYDTPDAPGFFLTVANTFAYAPEFEPQTGLPVAPRLGHGYGTQSIAAFAKKYGATLQFDVAQGYFYMSLLFRP